MTDGSKRCPACGLDQPLTEWGKNRTNKGGLQSNCNPCRRARRLANIDKVNAANRVYAAANRERARENSRRWREQNRERARERDRQYYLANRERMLEQSRNRDKDVKRAGDAAYRAAHVFEIRAYQLNLRARKEAVVGEVTPDDLRARLAYYGERCWICGAEWSDFDHVKPQSVGGANLPVNLRPACRDCNSRKHSAWPFDVDEFRAA